MTFTEEFLQQPLEKVKEILQRHSLAVQTEDHIFDCTMRWVRHDVDKRKGDLHELLTTCVHMGLLDERYLQEYVIPDDLIHACELEAAVLRLRREDQTPKQRGYTNMIVVAGGEGPCEE